MTQRLVFAAVLIALAACSNRSIYEGVQAGNRNECLKLPPVQYDECMARSSQSFEDYQRERDAAAER